MKKHLKTILLPLFALLSSPSLLAENLAINEKSFSLSDKGAKIITFKNQESIHLKSGSATVKGLDFSNGTIEYDIAFKQERGFLGVEFRKQGDNSEEFYIRPHQSGNPDANQYTPVYNGLSAWQLYHHGFAGKVNYNFNDWNHIKIVAAESQGEVYINDMNKPAFTINEFLHSNKNGEVSFYSNIADSYIANIKITPQDSPVLKGSTKTPNKLDDQLIQQFDVSNSFSHKALDKATKLPAKLADKLKWKPIKSDSYGIINLAKAQGVTKEANTVLAKTTINAKQDKVMQLQFGYSDKVQVYLNGTLLYVGDNTFRTRDYRYLGTIGLFDQLALPLSKGDNELVFAVSERFGGWGLKAKVSSF